MAPREDQRHQTRDMMGLARRAFAWALVSAAMTLISIVTEPAVAVAVEVGQPAPDFKLPSTTGGDVALSDFRGKKWVLLEFYGADFAPTWAANLSARKADYKRFEDLGIQNIAASANNTFSQQTFAESLKLPFPLLSDFPDRSVMRSYGVLNERTMTANRSFFLIDPQGIVRRKWIIENPTTTVVYSDGLLRDIREVPGKRWRW
jgi:thioredoxin-dependent peroxiredoxin